MISKSSGISIHALREEGDYAPARRVKRLFYFYPRPPRGGRRDESHAGMVWDEFLSTPSARRATSRRVAASDCKGISIHALREEGDADQISVYLSHDDFYPRPPRGGRPVHADTSTAGIYFYPRPPRGGRQLPQWVTTMIMNFYPRPPRGGRPLQIRLDETADRFLSTPSARRATIPFSATLSLPMYFYPRPPRGGRPLALQHTVPHKPISIHALREEGDVRRSHHSCRSRISIHALREEGDLYFWPFVSR